MSIPDKDYNDFSGNYDSEKNVCAPAKAICKKNLALSPFACREFGERDIQKAQLSRVPSDNIQAYQKTQKIIEWHKRKNAEKSADKTALTNDIPVFSGYHNLRPGTGVLSGSRNPSKMKEKNYLLKGNTGEGNPLVMDVQLKLIELGYLKGGIDGHYAERNSKGEIGDTFIAIQEFQRDRNIEADGRLDEMTLIALFQAMPEEAFGTLSAAFESPGKGIASIGYDKSGGTSYGLWQLASQRSLDDFIDFLMKEDEGGAYLAKKLIDSCKKEIERRKRDAPKNKDNQTPPPLNCYDRGKYGALFPPAQTWIKYAHELHPYVKKFMLDRYYTTPMRKARKSALTPEVNNSQNDKSKNNNAVTIDYKPLWDMVEKYRTLREVYYSTSVQGGQNGPNKLFRDAYRKSKMTKDPAELIEKIYELRLERSPEHLKESNEKRYAREKASALKMLAFESEMQSKND